MVKSRWLIHRCLHVNSCLKIVLCLKFIMKCQEITQCFIKIRLFHSLGAYLIWGVSLGISASIPSAFSLATDLLSGPHVPPFPLQFHNHNFTFCTKVNGKHKVLSSSADVYDKNSTLQAACHVKSSAQVLFCTLLRL